MNPSTIQALIKQATLLHESETGEISGKYAAFFTSWVAWEALQTRFIRVVIHQQGWLIRDADFVLARMRISSMRDAATVLKVLHSEPSSWSGKSGKAWRALRKIEPLRNRLIHGFKTVEPSQLSIATSIVIHLISDHEWLSSLPLTKSAKKGEQVIVGSLLEPRSSPRSKNYRKREDLEEILMDNKQKSRKLKSIPYRAELEK